MRLKSMIFFSFSPMHNIFTYIARATQALTMPSSSTPGSVLLAPSPAEQKYLKSIYASMGKTPSELSSSINLAISLGSGVIAGVAAAIISHPADTLLSKINKAGAGGDGPMMTRMMNIAKEVGFVNLCTVGLLPRCVMIGTLTAGQFGLFDTVVPLLGASKFHFHDPNSH